MLPVALPSNNRPESWEDLPAELWVNIAKCLACNDLRNFRLLCRKLAVMDGPILLNSISVFPYESVYSDLKDCLSRTSLGEYVQKFIYRCAEIYPCPVEEWSACKQKPYTEQQIQAFKHQVDSFGTYTSHLNRMMSMLVDDDTYELLLLVQIMRKLPSINAITIHGCNPNSGGLVTECSNLKAFQIVRDDHLCYLRYLVDERDIWEFTPRPSCLMAGDRFILVLQAVIHAGRTIKALLGQFPVEHSNDNLSIGGKRYWDRTIESRPPTSRSFELVCSRLASTEQLDLCFNMSACEKSLGWMDCRFAMLTSKMSSLRQLTLSAYKCGSKGYEDFSLDFSSTRFPNLQKLKLIQLDSDRSGFQQWLGRHRRTLKCFHIQGLRLAIDEKRGLPEDFLSFFEWIRNHLLHLDSVALEGILTNGFNQSWRAQKIDAEVPGIPENCLLKKVCDWIMRKTDICPLPFQPSPVVFDVNGSLSVHLPSAWKGDESWAAADDARWLMLTGVTICYYE